MPDPKPDDRTAPAAQDDVLGEAASNTGSMDGLAGPGDEEKSGDRGAPTRPDRRAADGAARPGKDENQAGFVKDPDKPFSP